MVQPVDTDQVVDENCLRHLGTRLPLARVLVTASIREQLDAALCSVYDGETSTRILEKVDSQILASHLNTLIGEFEAYLSGKGPLNLRNCLEAVPDFDLFNLEEEDAYIFLGVSIHLAIHYLLRSKDVTNAWFKAKELVRKGERIEESEKITDLRAEGLRILKLCAKEGANLRTKEMAIKGSLIEKELPAKSLLASMRKRSIAVLGDLDPLWQKDLSQLQPTQELPEIVDTEIPPPKTGDTEIIIEEKKEEKVFFQSEGRVLRSGRSKVDTGTPTRKVVTANRESAKGKGSPFDTIPETEEPLDVNEGATSPSRKRKISVVDPSEWQADDIRSPVVKKRRRNDDANVVAPAANTGKSGHEVVSAPVRDTRQGFKAIRIHATPRSKRKAMPDPRRPTRYVNLTAKKGTPRLRRTFRTTGGYFVNGDDRALREGLTMYGWGEWTAIAMNFFQNPVEDRWKTPCQLKDRARYLQKRKTLIPRDFPVTDAVNRYGPRASNVGRSYVRKRLTAELDALDDDAIETFDDTQEEKNADGATGAPTSKRTKSPVSKKKSTPASARSRRSLLAEPAPPDVETETDEDEEPEEEPRVLRRSTRNSLSPKEKDVADKSKEAEETEEAEEAEEEPRPLRRSARHHSSQKENDAEDETENEGEGEKKEITLRRSQRRQATQ